MRRISLLCTILLLEAYAATAKPSVVLITIDTLRADHLSCYGYAKQTSPHIDAVASRGILYRKAYAPAPLTLPSHASLLTGLYPASHGMRDNAYFSPPTTPTIAQILKTNGYSTAAFVSGWPLKRTFGLSTGFDLYEDDFEGVERKGEHTTNLFLEWLQKTKEPFFAWIHYFDPHAPYEAPFDSARRFPESPYDGEIVEADTQVGRVVKSLPENTILIITADHGESLGEHEEKTHGVLLYEATLRVPLIVAVPNQKKAVVEEPVSLCDLFPSLLQWTGSSTIENRDGRPLLVSGQKSQNDRILFAESLYAQRNFGYAALYAAISQNKKLIYSPNPEFYDLATDPAEKDNLYGQMNAERWEKAVEKYSGRKTATTETPLSEEDREKLQALGYVSADYEERPIDPQDRISVIEEFNHALTLLHNAEYEQAETAFSQLSRSEKESALAYRFLGDALAGQEKWEAATVAYLQSWEIRNDPAVGLNLARAYFRLRKFPQAEKILRSLVVDYPSHQDSRLEMASFLAVTGRWEEAFQLLDQPGSDFANQRGVLYLQKKEYEKALVEFQKAIAAFPRAMYWNNFALAHQRLGHREQAEKAFLQALEKDPQYREAAVNLALLYVENRQYEKSLPLLEQVTARNRRLWNALFALAFVYENLGRKREATEIYTYLLDEAPDDWPKKEQVQMRLKNLH